ncbi:hypothetical protein AEMCBJ_04265 [Cupriavidus necator]
MTVRLNFRYDMELALDTALKIIAASAAISAALVTGVFAVIGHRIKAEYDRQIETHKAKLKAQGDLTIEQLKSTLAIAAAQQNAMFGGLIQRRFEAIAKVHGHLLRLKDAVEQLVAMFKPTGTDPEKEYSDVHSTHEAFKNAYCDNAIFLTDSTCAKIRVVEDHLRAAAMYYTYKRQLQAGDARPGRPDFGEKALEILKQDTALALAELEAEYRQLMSAEQKSQL